MNIIGLDIGTTGAKALLVREDGSVVSSGYASYNLISNGIRIEQRAEDWRDCSVTAIKKALDGKDAASVAAISLSTQGASTVAIDKNGNTIGNSITWMDRRSTAEADELVQALGGDYIYKTTGWRINPAMDAAKIMHMKRQERYKSATHFLSTLEYMNAFLTENAVIDPSNAAMRQLYNVSDGCWDKKLLDATGINAEELTSILPTGTFLGGLCANAAAATGLPKELPVYNGAHDQYCASLGSSAIQNGDMLLSAGTTWVVLGVSNKLLFTDTFIAGGKHPIPGLYGALASLVGSGASLQWYKNNFVTESFAEMDAEAKTRRDKIENLFFYPYLSGAFYPTWKLNAHGTFTGISLEHDKYDFALAIMEGVAFGVRRALADFSANGCSINTLKVLGGAAKSNVWCNIIANAANIQVDLMSESDACAMGAAVIAAYGAGIYPDLISAARNMVKTKDSISPIHNTVSYYDEKYERYDNMWRCLSQHYK